MPAWTESDWDLLLSRVAAGKCMPFLGAGASFGALPLGGAIARDWAKQFGYPFEDTGDLARVAQYLALVKDPAFPKELILDLIEKAKPPAFQEPDEPHGVLAELPLPIYMTTNYDGFMTLALRRACADVRRELCRWGVHLDDEPSAFEDAKFKPDLATPVVYHLHGHTRADSLVLTEDDYLRFLGSMTQGRALMPAPLESALASFALVFIGYRLADWNFRVLLQGAQAQELAAQRRGDGAARRGRGPAAAGAGVSRQVL